MTAVAAAPAWADLPRTYEVQRVDSPLPSVGGHFGLGFVNAGDLNGDGEDDLVVGGDKEARNTSTVGRVFVISGETGAGLRVISPPDPEPASTGDNAANFGGFVGKIADLAGCPGGSNGQLCAAPAIGDPDGVPDMLVTALGVNVDVTSTGTPLIDAGRAYLFDGATGALLKRLEMPQADLAHQQSVPPFFGPRKPFFGRSILSPASDYGATGSGTPPAAVRMGDLNAGGKPDIVVSAPGYFETDESAAVLSPCWNANIDPPETPPADRSIDARCLGAGRVYVFYGEDIAGSDPAVTENTPNVTIKNPTAQPDSLTSPVQINSENLGNSLVPLGDLGRCNSDPNGEETIGGDICTLGESRGVADGKPDMAIASPRTDEFGMFDVGATLLVDGNTSSVLNTYTHPEPQPAATFGYSNYSQPAVGDIAGGTEPDLYAGAIRQNNPFTGGGRGYVMNGEFRQPGNPGTINLSILNDPTPQADENFGTSAAGIGNVFGDSRNEIMVGALGPSPTRNENVVNDVHIFSALNEQELQRIEDPDGQPGAAFGGALAPLGDLNEDGFLDFAIGAGLHSGDTGAEEGRIYIFRSDNSPAPPPPPPPSGNGGNGAPGPAGPQGPPGPVRTLAGRSLELDANRERVRAGRTVRLSGMVEAYSNATACQRRQRVDVQRRRPGRFPYRTFAERTTNAGGLFSARTRPRRTYFYRARVRQTGECLGAASQREKVTVRRRARR